MTFTVSSIRSAQYQRYVYVCVTNIQSDNGTFYRILWKNEKSIVKLCYVARNAFYNDNFTWFRGKTVAKSKRHIQYSSLLSRGEMWQKWNTCGKDVINSITCWKWIMKYEIMNFCHHSLIFFKYIYSPLWIMNCISFRVKNVKNIRIWKLVHWRKFLINI